MRRVQRFMDAVSLPVLLDVGGEALNTARISDEDAHWRFHADDGDWRFHHKLRRQGTEEPETGAQQRQHDDCGYCGFHFFAVQ
jgi:hypothetical protein